MLLKAFCANAAATVDPIDPRTAISALVQVSYGALVLLPPVTGPGGLDKHQGARPPLINSADSHHQG